MREIRLYSSEGGGTGTTGPSYPYWAMSPNAFGVQAVRQTLAKRELLMLALMGHSPSRKIFSSFFIAASVRALAARTW